MVRFWPFVSILFQHLSQFGTVFTYSAWCANQIIEKNMAISEFEIKRCESELKKFLKKLRPPPHVRHEIDLAYRVENQSVVIFEIRPSREGPNEKMETPVAKTTYVKAQKLWKVFWERSDLKWHTYEPAPTVKYFEDFLSIVGEDSNACFFG